MIRLRSQSITRSRSILRTDAAGKRRGWWCQRNKHEHCRCPQQGDTENKGHRRHTEEERYQQTPRYGVSAGIRILPATDQRRCPQNQTDPSLSRMTPHRDHHQSTAKSRIWRQHNTPRITMRCRTRSSIVVSWDQNQPAAAAGATAVKRDSHLNSDHPQTSLPTNDHQTHTIQSPQFR